MGCDGEPAAFRIVCLGAFSLYLPKPAKLQGLREATRVENERPSSVYLRQQTSACMARSFTEIEVSYRAVLRMSDVPVTPPKSTCALESMGAHSLGSTIIIQLLVFKAISFLLLFNRGIPAFNLCSFLSVSYVPHAVFQRCRSEKNRQIFIIMENDKEMNMKYIVCYMVIRAREKNKADRGSQEAIRYSRTAGR